MPTWEGKLERAWGKDEKKSKAHIPLFLPNLPGEEEKKMTPIPVSLPVKRSPQDIQGGGEDINLTSMIGLASEV